MSVSPIPVTALNTVEYTPTPQDAQRYKREKGYEILLMRRRLDSGEPLGDEARELSKAIVDEQEFMERTLDTMRRTYPKPMTFVLQVPTTVEREQINSRLISLGLSQVTQERMRATMIDELFYQDWGKGSDAENEAEAENLANFLDSVWLRQEAHDVAIARWQEQEVERVRDEADGAPPRPSAEMPPKIIGVREAAKSTLLVETMMAQSQKLRDLAAQASDFNRMNALLLVRANVLGGSNIPIELARDPLTKALPESQALALREAMDDASWHDLVGKIDGMYRLDGGEEKNFDWPPERPLPQDGSIEPSDDSANSDGSSTSSSTTLPLGGVSATIIEPSSAYTSDRVDTASSTVSTSLTGEA